MGALAIARGERTHQLVTFESTGGFGDLPYGICPFGPGWIRKRHAWSEAELQQRAAWYLSRVSQCYLWAPLAEALLWFSKHADDETDRAPGIAFSEFGHRTARCLALGSSRPLTHPDGTAYRAPFRAASSARRQLRQVRQPRPAEP